MLKKYCTVLFSTLICISLFTFVRASDTITVEETIEVVDITPALEPAKPDVPVETTLPIEEPVEKAIVVEEIDEIVAVVESVKEQENRELSIADIYAEEAEYIAKTIWGEARGCSTTEQAAVAWCILNRVDKGGMFPTDIIKVVTQKNQFLGYNSKFPVTDELYELAIDIIERWQLEKTGCENVGRVLPKNYYFFHGDGKHNYFRAEYKSKDYWDWSLESPYEN